MAYRKSKNCTPLKPWLSAAPGNVEQHGFIQMGISLLDCPAFLKLSGSAVKVYLLLCREAGSKRDGFKLPRSSVQGVISPTAFNHAIKELCAAGFITYISGKTMRQENIYSFCFDWKKEKL